MRVVASVEEAEGKIDATDSKGRVQLMTKHLLGQKDSYIIDCFH